MRHTKGLEQKSAGEVNVACRYTGRTYAARAASQSATTSTTATHPLIEWVASSGGKVWDGIETTQTKDAGLGLRCRQVTRRSIGLSTSVQIQTKFIDICSIYHYQAYHAFCNNICSFCRRVQQDKSW
jgi:hypothetical protein